MAVSTYLIEMDGKEYQFNPGKEITLAEYEYMEGAYGVEYGGWFTFRDRLTIIGHHNAIRCLVWLVKRHREEFTGTDPRTVTLPENFEPGQFLEDIRNKDVLDDMRAKAEAESDPKEETSGPSPSSNLDGSVQSQDFEQS